MTNDELTEIQEYLPDVNGNFDVRDLSEMDAMILAGYVPELLAEVERSRGVAQALVTLAVQSAYDGKWFIPHVHAAHELVEQARALLEGVSSHDAR